MAYCEWCGVDLDGEYEEIMVEIENENDEFEEAYRPVCIECYNGAMHI